MESGNIILMSADSSLWRQVGRFEEKVIKVTSLVSKKNVFEIYISRPHFLLLLYPSPLFSIEFVKSAWTCFQGRPLSPTIYLSRAFRVLHFRQLFLNDFTACFAGV